uniref:TatA protein n=1 Tax=Minutocellus polymorphus TaxID=265543 RepID=A0A8A6KN45_9STRA|nr:TatA protein [Minutocellus polymorphus]QTI83148.1 TatA protein [Minutocellus polymorphus]
MNNISFGQLIIIALLLVLLFGDLSKIKQVFGSLKDQLSLRKTLIKKKNRKKGSWTLDLWFWKPLFYQLNYFPLIA